MSARAFRLERDFENAAVRFLHARGFQTRKMNGLGFRGWPDRLVFWPTAPKGERPRFEWIEFKREGEEPTPVQLKMHRLLRARGHKVHVVDNWKAFCAITKS